MQLLAHYCSVAWPYHAFHVSGYKAITVVWKLFYLRYFTYVQLFLSIKISFNCIENIVL